MIKALFKFAPYKWGVCPGLEIDTTSGSGEFAQLSPFLLEAPPAKRFENLWQFSKVYKKHLNETGWMTMEWYQWQKRGFDDVVAHRYPMGKGAIPEFTYWEGEKLGYIEARRKLYAPVYAQQVRKTPAYKKLEALYEAGHDIILRDYDAYDHEMFGMTLWDVINNPKCKMGHAFVLLMMLKGELSNCIS